MIIYSKTKRDFFNDIRDNTIADKIEAGFRAKHIQHNNDSEYRAWANSLNYVRNVIDDPYISDDCSVAVEYQVPLTSLRVDFLIAGQDQSGNNNVVIIELKQWEDSKELIREDIVEAYTGHAKRIVTHPCYQAYGYAKFLESFNESVEKENIKLHPCAYLHNYKERNRNHIDNDHYHNAILLAPLFLSNDTVKLRDFIKQFIKEKDGINLLMTLENGKLRPAKSLQDCLMSMIKGNKEFYLIDKQKVVYEIVKEYVEKAIRETEKAIGSYRKAVLICQGGPGTGKSVIAVQLLCDCILRGYSACYVTKNAAPRNVYLEKLIQGKYKEKYIRTLFRGPDSLKNVDSNRFHCIVADEAHRLKKSYGKNQIELIINAAQVCVFFIDEDQRITTKDIGTVEEIKKCAAKYNCEIIEGEEFILKSQFRCFGSDGYLAFLDNLLQIRPTANFEMSDDYEIKLFDSPVMMREELRKKNEISNKSRMLAGYCYEWYSRTDPFGEKYDIELEDGFKAKWNFENTSTWAIDPNSFDQVGCIHTSQGLEFDYCGVIIGQDLRYENESVITDQEKEAESDGSSGIKHCRDKDKADMLIRNTYRTLLSRGQKGCYIYCEDKALLKYMSEMLGKDIIKETHKILYPKYPIDEKYVKAAQSETDYKSVKRDT